jgi:hypothetical protein
MSQNEKPLLEAIEKVLDSVLAPQWLPGYEPDPSKQNETGKKSNKGKRHARNKALGIKPNKKRK